MYYIQLFLFNTDLTYEISSPIMVTYRSLMAPLGELIWSSKVNQFT